MASLALRIWLLVFGLTAAAAPNVPRDANDDTTISSTVAATPTTSLPTVTVTVTSTPLGPTTVTVTRTSTRSVWSTSVVVTENLNCTRTVLTASPAAASPSPAVVAGAEPGFIVAKRQGSETPTSTSTPALPTSPTSTLAAPTSPPRITRTRTIWVVSTAAQSTPYTRTNYQCAATLAYLLTTDATTTVPYTLTRYASTVTATSTINCPFGLGGFGGLGGIPTPVPPNAPLPTPPAVGASVDVAEVKRQNTGANTTATPVANGPVVVETIHLTRTTYSLVTLNATVAATVQRYECSTTPYDATVTYNVTRTAWTSTATLVSVLECGLPSRPPVTSTRPTVPPTPPASKLKRQTTSTETTSSVSSSASAPVPTPTSATVHRTRYIFGTVTVTATVPTTRLVYSCAATSAATPSTTAAPSTTATPSVS